MIFTGVVLLKQACDADGAIKGQLVDGRYRIEQKLGAGGLAVVYRVHDTVTGTDKALKRLHSGPDRPLQRQTIELLEREFHALAQLAHPRTVVVYDYGFDGSEPYYTMELLDGGDLHEGAPIEWRRACALLRDVCSALSLLHSRRLVHRDLSPRNVRCTLDGQAKLIDFGGVVPIGPSKQMVGTAAFCAPEAIDFQPLDARTDLYSLGATLYYTLTSRQVYAARDFRHLRELWAHPPSPPSRYVADIPEALDELVMSLLQLDPALRPNSAAEVMERLSGIAELPLGENLLVSQAYLSMPLLVSRESHLARIRHAVNGARAGRGSALMIRGTAGLGRSRLLDACALEANLAGVIVLRGDAADAQSGDYGVLRALALQLLDRLPELAWRAAAARVGVLAHVVPELLDRDPGAVLTVFADSAQVRPHVQAELRAWISEIAQTKPLMLAIDDIHLSDEPSAAVIALLARAVAAHALSIVVSAAAESTRSGATFSLLSDACAVLQLEPLESEQTRTLLESVFGGVPNLELVASRLHAVAAGNPRDVMRLAQHLVDKHIVSYQAGSWSLPAQIDVSDLPSSIAEALTESVAGLGSDARALAQALALSPDQHFTFQECLVLSGHCAAKVLSQSLDQLVLSYVIQLQGERWGIAQQAWVTPLQSALDATQARALHQRLAEVFELRSDQMRVVRHLLHAGEGERAVDASVHYALTSQGETDPSSDAFVRLIDSLPSDWMECFDSAIRLCEQLGRPRRCAFELRSRMSGLLAVSGVSDTTHLSALLRQLEMDSGLDIYATLDPTLEPGLRLQRTFQLTQERYTNSSEHERVSDALTAIRRLAQALVQTSAAIVIARNLEFCAQLPSLLPYVALSPALGVVQQMMDAVGQRCSGRSEAARRLYSAILARTSQPDHAGLDESHHLHGTFGVKYGMGLLEAALGLESSLEWAAEIESNPLYQVNAWTIRMLYHLWQGQTQDADRCRDTARMLRVQNSRRQFFEGSDITLELTAHVAAGDLMKVKQSISVIEALVTRYPGWQPMLDYARGEYQRLRGGLPRALTHFEAALKGQTLGGHELWAHAAGGYIKTLTKLGHYDQAIAYGTQIVQAAQVQELDEPLTWIRIPLALALAKAGSHEQASCHADAALEELHRLGTTGLRLAMAYRIRARVARVAGAAHAAHQFSMLALGALQPGVNPKLLSKYALVREQPGDIEADAALGSSTHQGSVISRLLTQFEHCTTRLERAQCYLELLVGSSGAEAGFLYVANDQGVDFVAQLGDRPLPRDIDRQARDFLTRALQEDEATRVVEASDSGLAIQTRSESKGAWLGSQGAHYRGDGRQHDDEHQRREHAHGLEHVSNLELEQLLGRVHDAAEERYQRGFAGRAARGVLSG